VIAFVVAEGVSAWLMARLGPIYPELVLLTSTARVPPMPLYTVAGLGAACVVVGGCLLISDRLKALGVLHLLTPAGRQTLTLYIAHILVGMGTLEALGMLEHPPSGDRFGSCRLEKDGWNTQVASQKPQAVAAKRCLDFADRTQRNSSDFGQHSA